MSKCGRFDVHYPNGMRTRVDTPEEAITFVSHHYLLPVIIRSVAREAHVPVFMHEWPEPPGRRMTIEVVR